MAETDALIVALRSCVGCMEMQEGRERGEFHISRESFSKLWSGALDNARRVLSRQSPTMTKPVPADVARLVVAARIVAFENQSPEALRELDQATEAFASRVPWDDDERDPPLSHQQG